MYPQEHFDRSEKPIKRESESETSLVNVVLFLVTRWIKYYFEGNYLFRLGTAMMLPLKIPIIVYTL